MTKIKSTKNLLPQINRAGSVHVFIFQQLVIILLVMFITWFCFTNQLLTSCRIPNGPVDMVATHIRNYFPRTFHI